MQRSSGSRGGLLSRRAGAALPLRMAALAGLDAIPSGYGYLEHVRETDGQLEIAGWLLALDGPFDHYEVHGEHGRLAKVEPAHRPDLGKAIPHVAGAERGAFHARVPIPPGFGPGRTLELTVVGVRGGRPTARMPVGLHRPSQRPMPPEAMRVRATGNASEAFYLATGVKACNDFLRALRPHLDLASVREMLEWGSGAGRLTRHLIDRLPGATVHGTDIDAEAVRWADENLGGTFVPCGQEPPLPYRDAQFDLIVNLSVFTHLLERHQHLWLAELRRVLKPGGTMLATTHGQHAGRWMFPDPKAFAEIFRTGFFDGIPDPGLQHVASSAYYRSTFQSYEWTKRTFGGYFDLLSFTEGGMNCFQDIWVMRKK